MHGQLLACLNVLVVKYHVVWRCVGQRLHPWSYWHPPALPFTLRFAASFGVVVVPGCLALLPRMTIASVCFALSPRMMVVSGFMCIWGFGHAPNR